MAKLIKKGIFFIVILILLGILAFFCYLTFVDTNSTKAKEYLLEKYDINEKDWQAIKYTKYIYEDIADCNSLWFKKCTTNKDLQFTYTFRNKAKEEIIVSEYLDGTYTDEYTGIIPLPLKEKEEKNEEVPDPIIPEGSTK